MSNRMAFGGFLDPDIMTEILVDVKDHRIGLQGGL
jgi:hypothetical protein